MRDVLDVMFKQNIKNTPALKVKKRVRPKAFCISVRVVLVFARHFRSLFFVSLASKVAANRNDCQSAVYYVLIRHIPVSPVACRLACKAALKGQLNESQVIAPLLEALPCLAAGRRATALKVIDGLAGALGDMDLSVYFAEGVERFSNALVYAREMLEAKFVEAYKVWASMRRTQEFIRDLDQVASEFPIPVLSRSLPRYASLAVVLPGTMLDSDVESIKHHDLVARTTLDQRCGKSSNRSLPKSDLVFLNLDRYKNLHASDFVGGDPPVITKPVPRMNERLPNDLKVYFELKEPELPTAVKVNLPVSIALWTMAAFERPATFLCGDFYLGDRIYQSDAYDPKRQLESRDSVLACYLEHDVFFVHAFLSHFVAKKRIRAEGMLRELLVLDGFKFAARLEQRWN